MKVHSRNSDILLLIQFVEDQGFDILYLVEAADRLTNSIEKELADYSVHDYDEDKGD